MLQNIMLSQYTNNIDAITVSDKLMIWLNMTEYN